MKVFVDSSAWLAFYDRKDAYHQAAREIFHQLKQQRANLALSDFILSESLTIIRYRLGHRLAVAFGRDILDSRLAELIDVTAALRDQAWQIFQRYQDKDFSFVDCTSFAVMDQYELRMAFTFDRHFEQYGFRLLGQ